MATPENLNLITLSPYFSDGDKARELLESLRWPDGPVCPHCGNSEAYKLEAKPESKTAVRTGVYKCKKCRKQFTVTVGTIFEDSRIPLSKWLAAIYMMCASKKGVSAHQLHRELGITYKSAWFMCHRIRLAMEDGPLASMLSGIVEVDETYVGGKPRKENKPRDAEEGEPKKNKRGRGTDKTPVVAIVEREGKVKAQKVSNLTSASLKTVIRENVDQQSYIMTDGFTSYEGLADEYEGHGVVFHSLGEYAFNGIHINTAESWFALLKRGYVGTFHRMSDTHLNRYAAEFVFRWDNRKINDGERTKRAIEGVKGKRLMYKNLIKTEK